MFFQWLKRYLPRSLYGRAALILILPVVMLQLVVSVVFIQRHFNGVTRQMTQNLTREINLVLSEAEAQATIGTAHRALAVEVNKVALTALPVLDARRWYDFTGIVVTRELRAGVAGVRAVHLPDDYDVRLFVASGESGYELAFSRGRVSASNPHQLLVNMVFFGILLTVIAFIYLRNQLRPIRRLAEASDAFGRGQHVPYKPAGATEVRAAGAAFVSMRARIERQIEQRTLMLSGVSHDLRTPLTRLRLGLSMLEDEERAPMERDVEDMQRLLDEFLSFAKGDQEGGSAEPVDAIELVRQVVDDCARAQVNVRLASIEGGSDEAGTSEVNLRALAIRRALENLINNAVRYGENAQVSVRLSPKSLRIRVEDDGPGIPPERYAEAVRPFARLDAARNQNKGTSVGLGLSIATDIARSHGGVLRLGKSDEMGGLRADIVIAR